MDKEKLLPGQEWELEIEKSVKGADVVIVCLSEKSVEKVGYYQKEIKKILDVADEKPEGTIFVIPLRLDECRVPYRLAKWQYEDYFPREKAIDSYKNIRESLKLRAKSISVYSPISSDYEIPMLLHDAILIAKTNEKVTVSLLQRRLRIGYTKGVELIETMEESGLIKKSDDEGHSWEFIVK